MSAPEQVAAYDQESQVAGALGPVHQFNAAMLAQLVPRCGTLLDLGSGSARLLARVAMQRPDIRAIGLELSEGMLAVGRAHLRTLGLAERVELRPWNMCEASRGVPEPVHLISSVFSLHHLGNNLELRAAMAEIALLAARTQAAIWLFDLVRPKHPRTAAQFGQCVSPAAPAPFLADTAQSLVAAWRPEEIAMAWPGTLALRHAVSRWLSLYQVHWRFGASPGVVKPEPHQGQRDWFRTQLFGHAPLPDTPGLR